MIALIAAPLLWGFGLLVLYGVLAARGELFFSLSGLLAIFVATGLHVLSAAEGGFLIPLLAQSYLSNTSDAAPNFRSLLPPAADATEYSAVRPLRLRFL